MPYKEIFLEKFTFFNTDISISKNIKKQIMPQLVPFYFMNEIIFTFTLITLNIYVLTKYILPRFVRLFLSRSYISTLFTKN